MKEGKEDHTVFCCSMRLGPKASALARERADRERIKEAIRADLEEEYKRVNAQLWEDMFALVPPRPTAMR